MESFNILVNLKGRYCESDTDNKPVKKFLREVNRDTIKNNHFDALCLLKHWLQKIHRILKKHLLTQT